MNTNGFKVPKTKLLYLMWFSKHSKNAILCWFRKDTDLNGIDETDDVRIKGNL